jgi:MFS family permease
VLIFRLTDSAVLLGVLQFAQFGPILLLAPWTGSAADRFDRRRLLLITQAAQTTLTATLAGLAFAGAATEYVVLGFALLLGVLTAFALPAQQALLASLVERDDLPSAVALNSMTYNLARAFGRDETVGGYLLGAFGAGAVTAAFIVAGRTAGSRRRMALTLGLLGTGMTLFALTPWLPLAFVALFVAGFGYLASNTSATSRLQLEVSESQRGRIMALWGIAFLGVRPLASLVDGAIAQAAGVRAAGVVLALPALLLAVAIAVWGRQRTVSVPVSRGSLPKR